MSKVIISKLKEKNSESKATLADSIPNDECWTIEEISDDFGLSSLRTRQILDKALKDKIVQNLTKKDGRRILYAPQMIEQLQKAKEKGLLGKFNKRKQKGFNLKNAQLVITTPIFDPEIVKLLRMKFGSDENIQKYVKANLEESVKPIMQKLKEINERYEQEKANVLRESQPEVSV